MYTRDFPLETIFHVTLLNQPASTTDRHTDIIFFTNSVTHSQIDNDDDRLRNTFNLNTLGEGGGGRSRKASHSSSGSTIQKRLKPCVPFPASRTSRRRLVLHLGSQIVDQPAIESPIKRDSPISFRHQTYVHTKTDTRSL